MPRPTVTGAIIVVVTCVAYAILPASIRNSATLGWVVWLIPGVAALFVASRAPRYRILLALLMAPLAAVTVSLINLLDWVGGGVTDFPGLRGALVVVQLQLVTGVPFALVGGVLGRLIAKQRELRETQPEDPENPREP